MIQHLSAEQISQWMMGERTPQLERHVAECDECRAELGQLETALAQFRGAVREWSGSATPPAWRQPAARGPWFSRQRLVMAAAARADALLLERVDSAISRAVPEPMEPLVNLVTWNSSPAENAKKLERQ